MWTRRSIYKHKSPQLAVISLQKRLWLTILLLLCKFGILQDKRSTSLSGIRTIVAQTVLLSCTTLHLANHSRVLKDGSVDLLSMQHLATREHSLSSVLETSSILSLRDKSLLPKQRIGAKTTGICLIPKYLQLRTIKLMTFLSSWQRKLCRIRATFNCRFQELLEEQAVLSN